MIFLLLCLLTPGDVTVTLPMEAHARGTEVELGEIARISGADEAEVELISQLELGYAPAPGYSRLFAADKIQEIVSRKAPDVRVHVIGQRACRVYPEVDEISGAEILATARGQLKRDFGLREAIIEPAGDVSGVQVPAGASEHEIRARLDKVPTTSGTFNIPVDILVDDVRYRTVWTSWSIKLWETRPVLTRAVRTGEPLRPEMFEAKRVLVETKNGAAPLDAEGIRGSVALRDFAPGELVTGLDVNRPNVIQLGETLFLRVKKGPIEARVSALALESGAIGDRIRVRTRESAQDLVAIVITRDLCEIHIGR